ncbi:MAG: hypothetical protein H0U23_10515, partial [Blastocatellia bacterium]|nr:hypothetical protein [Blastocatellia bacterium]
MSIGQLLGWVRRYARPYRSLFAVFVFVSIVEIGIGLAAPWTMKVLVDNVLGNQPVPAWLVPAVDLINAESKIALLVAVCVAGLAIGLSNQFVSLWHTQLQVGIGQKMVLDLQRDLF